MFDCALMVRNNVLRETCMCALGWSKQSNDLTSRQPVMYVIWMVILFVRRRKGTKTEEKNSMHSTVGSIFAYVRSAD